MSPGDSRDEPSVDEAWSSVAEAVGAELVPGFGSPPRVRKVVGDWIITLDRMGAGLGAYTRLRAPYAPSDGFAFAIRDGRLLDDVLESLGFLQDVVIGDAELDRRFLFKSSSWSKLRAVLTDARVREILRRQPALSLRADRFPLHGSSYGAPVPKGLWELQFRESGDITDVARLEGLFQLLEILLERLCPEGRGYEGDLQRLVARLLGPGWTVADPPGGGVVLDGNLARRDAAVRLGRLGDAAAVGPLTSVLDDPDEELVARAAAALGALGDPAAVGPLVRLLGRRGREVDGATVSGHAARALERLRREEVVRAFEEALAGEPSRLREAAGVRSEAVEALQDVLESAAFAVAAPAARALGALGAREAVPLLRSKSRGWGMKTTLTEACVAALEAIEARAGLPRPADPGGPGRDTLPRPADGSGVSPEGLPRSVDGEGGDP